MPFQVLLADTSAGSFESQGVLGAGRVDRHLGVQFRRSDGWGRDRGNGVFRAGRRRSNLRPTLQLGEVAPNLKRDAAADRHGIQRRRMGVLPGLSREGAQFRRLRRVGAVAVDGLNPGVGGCEYGG
jgi:hypothetical protein